MKKAQNTYSLENQSYDVINTSNDIAMTVIASSLQDAKKKVDKMISNDGSYWYENGFRKVRDPKTNNTLPLKKS